MQRTVDILDFVLCHLDLFFLTHLGRKSYIFITVECEIANRLQTYVSLDIHVVDPYLSYFICHCHFSTSKVALFLY